jgi:hypothetical protein
MPRIVHNNHCRPVINIAALLSALPPCFPAHVIGLLQALRYSLPFIALTVNRMFVLNAGNIDTDRASSIMK